MDQRIVAALVELTHTLGLTVTAEGIETPPQLKRFQALGCDAGQGSLFGLPSPAEQIDALLRTTPGPMNSARERHERAGQTVEGRDGGGP